jgi:hypothetical protein
MKDQTKAKHMKELKELGRYFARRRVGGSDESSQ